jgi:hyperosmotically inducible periplasmic protein
VRHELLTLPYYSVFDKLAFRGSGDITRPAMKSSAVNVVKDRESVDHVQNDIKVLPVSPDDNQIRRSEYRGICSQPSLNKYAMRAVPTIHIFLDNGHVTLEGGVANEDDKNIAGIQAKTVPGVFAVTNNLRVDQSI